MEITNEILAKINKFTRREHNADELFVFEALLCDNEIDRDNERFTKEALKQLSTLFVGKTGIFDHNPKSGNQSARIFSTYLETDNTRKTSAGEDYTCLKAQIYMVRTESNNDLIKEIDAGIKKEISISCSCRRKVCSICGASRKGKPCSHINGKFYSNSRCHTILDDVTDAYEWSFVAVPAQVEAGVKKHYGTLENDDALEKLEESIELYRKSVIDDIRRMGCLKTQGAVGKTFSNAVSNMTLNELIQLKSELISENSKVSSRLQLSSGNMLQFKT